MDTFACFTFFTTLLVTFVKGKLSLKERYGFYIFLVAYIHACFTLKFCIFILECQFAIEICGSTEQTE